MKVPFYGHQRQYLSIKSEIDAKIQDVLMSGQYVQGPMLKKFEEELAAYAGANYAVGVGNGTDALWLTFMALGLGEGDELITNANTFVHPCNGEAAFKGFQVMMAACRSVVQRGKVALPLGPGEPELDALKRVLQE